MSESEQHHETKGHVRGSSILLFGRMISLAINFVVQVLIVRYLSKEGYGAFAYGYSVAMLATRFTPLGIDKAVSRFIPIFHEENNLGRIKGSLIVVAATILVMGTLLVGITLASKNFLAASVVRDPVSLSVLMMIISLAPLTAIENILEKLLAVFGRVKSIFFRRYIVTPLLRLAAVCSLIFAGGDPVFLAIAYVVTTFLGVLITLQILSKVFREDEVLSQLGDVKSELPTKRLFRFGVPLLSSDVVYGLRTSLVVILLEIFHGTTGVAAFRAILPVARLNQVVFDSFRLLYVPTASRMFARGELDQISQIYWRSTAWIGLLTFPVFLMSFSLSTPTVVFLFGDAYESSGPVLSLVAIGLYLNSAFGFNTLTLRVFNRVGTIFKIDMAAGALALILNLLAVPIYGPMGGAAVCCCVLVGQNVAYQIAVMQAGQLSWIPADVARVHGIIFTFAIALWGVQYYYSPPLIAGLLIVAALTLGVWATCFRALEIRQLFPEIDRFIPRQFLKGDSIVAKQVSSEPTISSDQVQR